MKILVANLGSTSFKYRLLDMSDETQHARGSVERIGSQQSLIRTDIGSNSTEIQESVPDHGCAVDRCLATLTDPELGCLNNVAELAGVGFKAVHGGRLSGVHRIDETVLEAMSEFNDVAPAHNPPYVSAMVSVRKKLPDLPMVAAFETGFHDTIPVSARSYAVPFRWSEDLNVRKWGFHGASHRYIAQRSGEILPECSRVVSMHLGGSSSLCGILEGKSIGTSMGMSPQSGLPQNNRVGDFDPFAIPVVMRRTGKSLEKVLGELATQSGLLGLSGISGDIRDLEQAAAQGNDRAQLALDVYTGEVRRHLGGLMIQLGGIDLLVFTGGIGENGIKQRAAICRELGSFGIELDPLLNQNVTGENAIQSANSNCKIWVIPTNEEIIVARQTVECLKGC